VKETNNEWKAAGYFIRPADSPAPVAPPASIKSPAPAPKHRTPDELYQAALAQAEQDIKEQRKKFDKGEIGSEEFYFYNAETGLALLKAHETGLAMNVAKSNLEALKREILGNAKTASGKSPNYTDSQLKEAEEVIAKLGKKNPNTTVPKSSEILRIFNLIDNNELETVYSQSSRAETGYFSLHRLQKAKRAGNIVRRQLYQAEIASMDDHVLHDIAFAVKFANGDEGDERARFAQDEDSVWRICSYDVSNNSAPGLEDIMPWLSFIESGHYEESYSLLAPGVKKNISKEEWVKSLKEICAPFAGRLLKRHGEKAKANRAHYPYGELYIHEGNNRIATLIHFYEEEDCVLVEKLVFEGTGNSNWKPMSYRIEKLLYPSTETMKGKLSEDVWARYTTDNLSGKAQKRIKETFERIYYEDSKIWVKEDSAKWLALMDAGKFAENYAATSEQFKKSVKAGEWEKTITDARKRFGKVLTRKWKFTSFGDIHGSGPDGKFQEVIFETDFSGKKGVVEIVTFIKEENRSEWEAAGYSIRPADSPAPAAPPTSVSSTPPAAGVPETVALGWLTKLDLGKYEEVGRAMSKPDSWREGYLTNTRKTKGALLSRKFAGHFTTEKWLEEPGKEIEAYAYEVTFANQKDATFIEVIFFRKTKSGDYRPDTYIVKKKPYSKVTEEKIYSKYKKQQGDAVVPPYCSAVLGDLEEKHARAWLALIDAGKYVESFTALASKTQEEVFIKTWLETWGKRKSIGELVSRQLLGSEKISDANGQRTVSFVFKRKSALKTVIETLKFTLDSDNVWRPAQYDYARDAGEIVKAETELAAKTPISISVKSKTYETALRQAEEFLKIQKAKHARGEIDIIALLDAEDNITLLNAHESGSAGEVARVQFLTKARKIHLQETRGGATLKRGIQYEEVNPELDSALDAWEEIQRNNKTATAPTTTEIFTVLPLLDDSDMDGLAAVSTKKAVRRLQTDLRQAKRVRTSEKVLSRQLVKSDYYEKSEYRNELFNFLFDTKFSDGKNVKEDIRFEKEKGTGWRLESYYQDEILPGPDAKDVEAWLMLMDAGRYAENYVSLADEVRQKISQEDWIKSVVKMRERASGYFAQRRKLTQRTGKLGDTNAISLAPGYGYAGKYSAWFFIVFFPDRTFWVEKLSFKKMENGTWKPLEYAVFPQPGDASENYPFPYNVPLIENSKDEKVWFQNETAEWLALLESGKYKEGYAGTSEALQSLISESQWISALEKLRGSAGAVISRKLESDRYKRDYFAEPKKVGADEVTVRTLTWTTEFSHAGRVKETVVFLKDSASTWRIRDYTLSGVSVLKKPGVPAVAVPAVPAESKKEVPAKKI
jgi:hypothetical protein